MQPKGWIKKHTITEEHKVKTIMQYNKNINTFIYFDSLHNKPVFNDTLDHLCMKHVII